MEPSVPLPHILIVDDSPENVAILGNILSNQAGIKVALNGPDALRLSVIDPVPDLILLDIMMPLMDGYQVCRLLKQNPLTQDIPIIFITALTHETDELAGLDAGAVDYITKPFHHQLVKSRVRNHLGLRVAQKQLAEYASRLEYLVQERTQELADTHARLKLLDQTKSEYLRAIAHELLTPTNGILGLTQYAIEHIASETLRREIGELFDLAGGRMQETIKNALQIADLQTGNACLKSTPLPLREVLREALSGLEPQTKDAQVTITTTESSSEWVMGDRHLLMRSLSTLIHAMVLLAKAGTTVQVHVARAGHQSVLSLNTEFKGLRPPSPESFFDFFSPHRQESYLEALGLALPLASRIVQAMHGSVTIPPSSDAEFTMHISLPAVTPGSFLPFS